MVKLFLLLSLSNGGNSFIQPVVDLEFQGNPGGIYAGAITSDGRIFLAYPKSGSILCFDRNGKVLPSIGKKGQGPGEFNWPRVVFYDAPFLYVGDSSREQLHRIDPQTGKFLQKWRLRGLRAISIKGNRLLTSYVLPQSANVFGVAKLGKEIEFQQHLGKTPCCLAVSGSHHGAVLQASDGALWVSFTGEFLLQKYSSEGKLLNSISKEPIDYVVPSQPKKVNRFDTGALSANVMSFDKASGLYEFKKYIIFYRFKRRSDSYFDIFDKSGRYVKSKKSDGIKPIGVMNGTFYALFSSDNLTLKYDVSLVKLNFEYLLGMSRDDEEE